jgi:bifunctional UDP-N-acetylglucosamine pyrophosphorylase/glucosamine-1-phosphate N-acetyltransferase
MDRQQMSRTAVILAAGKGTRMKSDLPKVLHEVCGRPMLSYVIDACRTAGCSRLLVVIGHEADRVREDLVHLDRHVAWVPQAHQLGTGHAVIVCSRYLVRTEQPVVILAGDGPLVRADTLARIVQTHVDKQAACTLATSILDDPRRYGRIVRDAAGELDRIVEYLDATEAERAIREVNVSMYCFDARHLLETLPKITNDNAKGEYYITDTLGILKAEGATVAAVPAVPQEEVVSINTIEELQQVERIMQARLDQTPGVGHDG